MIQQVRSVRTGLTSALVVASVLVATFLVAIPTASALPYSGGLSPTVISGGADLNGDGVVNGRDDSNAFFGDTSIIDGKLDCNAWGNLLINANAGTAGDGSITAADDCKLVAYDGTADGVTIQVTDGAFAWTSGTALPTVYNAADPANPGVVASDFAWSTIGGLVDSNGDESIDGTDCTFGLIGVTVDVGLGVATDGADVLGNPGANECGFTTAPSTLDNGKVDLNSDTTITAADSCVNGCFFGHNLTLGIVQMAGAVPTEPTITSFAPTAGPVGTTVTITGTNLTGATSVRFHGTTATITSNTATTIVTTVPAGATTGTITVTTALGTATNATSFTVMAITSFTPITGPVGTTVTITGTGLGSATSVKFHGTTATITSNTATTIVTTVPAGATTGTITVTNATGTATSATSFTVTVPSHARNISLRLRDALVARGKITVSDGFAACAASVAVKIQKRVSGHWKTVKNTTTSSTGAYRTHLRDRHGRYRSFAPRATVGADVCSKAASPIRRYR